MFVPYVVPILVYSSDDEDEDGNPPMPSHLPPNESIEHEHAPNTTSSEMGPFNMRRSHYSF
jgi:hypothetical protein